MRRSCILVALVGLCSLTAIAAPKSRLPRSTPEKQGVSPTGLLGFIEALDGIDALHSVMVIRHGQVIAEGWWAPYDADSNHELYSLSKSFTSTAVGMAISEGHLSLDDEVVKFFPNDAPAEPSANLKAMRVRDLLTMSTGHQDEPATSPEKMSPASFLAQAVPHKPGTHFKYNTAATFMLSAIVQKQTGQTVLDYLRPRLFEPLGISQPTWNTNFQGVSLGGYGLRVRTEDIAAFGQLYLQRGRWHGRQILPESWVDLATSRQVSNGSSPTSDWDQGYGFQFWRCRHDAYRGDGAFGQYCIVLPDQDAVVAITSGVRDMQAVLNVVWERLLPALKAKRQSSDPAGRAQLTRRLANLSVRTPSGAATAPVAPLAGRRFVFPDNPLHLEWIRVSETSGPGWMVSQSIGGTVSQMSCGYEGWIKGRGHFGTFPDQAIAGSAAWTSEDTLTVKVAATETPFYQTVRLRFQGQEVTREAEANVGFGQTRQPSLTGRSE